MILGLKNLATLSNELEIANLDLQREDSMIRKYQKKLSRQEYMSNNYHKNLEKIPQMAKQKKQQNKQRIPPIKQIPHKKI